MIIDCFITFILFYCCHGSQHALYVRLAGVYIRIYIQRILFFAEPCAGRNFVGLHRIRDYKASVSLSCWDLSNDTLKSEIRLAIAQLEPILDYIRHISNMRTYMAYMLHGGVY